MSFLYFLRAGQDGPVKIGFTSRPTQRFSALSGSNPSGLILLRMDEGNRANEKWLHEYFSHKHIRGEWFVYDQEMLTVKFGEVCPEIIDSPEQSAVKEEARKIVQAAGECAPEGASVHMKISFAASRLGLSRGRAKRLWYREQKIIAAAELEYLRALYSDILEEVREEISRRADWVNAQIAQVKADRLERECGG
mgnify:CR=1 FL=1